MITYLFDVDGTLTPSRCKIDLAFHDEFLKFCKEHTVALVTGSDYEKTYEQLGHYILNEVAYSFNCSGNTVYQCGRLIQASDWTVAADLRSYLEHLLKESKYPGEKTGLHLEERAGTANFSIVGRNANTEQRSHYYSWDCDHSERHTLATQIRNNFLGIDAVVGGETGIDIFPVNCDKSQVLTWFDTGVVFFGDQCSKGGNDYALADAIIQQDRGTVFQVSDWMHTRDILRGLYGEHILPINH